MRVRIVALVITFLSVEIFLSAGLPVYAVDTNQSMVVALNTGAATPHSIGPKKSSAPKASQATPTEKKSNKPVVGPAPQKARIGSLPKVLGCVHLPYQFTAQGNNLAQGNILCKIDCNGAKSSVPPKQRSDKKVTCRFEGSYAGQNCQVGVVVDGKWSRRNIKTCAATKIVKKSTTPLGGRKMPIIPIMPSLGTNKPRTLGNKNDKVKVGVAPAPNNLTKKSTQKTADIDHNTPLTNGGDNKLGGGFGAQVRKLQNPNSKVVATAVSQESKKFTRQPAILLPRCPDPKWEMTEKNNQMYRCDLPSYSNDEPVSPYDYLSWLEQQSCDPAQYYNVGPIINHNLVHNEIGSPGNFWYKFTCRHSESGGKAKPNPATSSPANNSVDFNHQSPTIVKPKCPANYFMEHRSEIKYRCVRWYKGNTPADAYTHLAWLEQQPCDLPHIYNTGPVIGASIDNNPGPWGNVFRFACSRESK